MLGVVIGSYQIIRKLGEGGMGAVYLGQHQLLGRRAAIKVLLTELSARPDIVNRFFNEARAVTSISDPGIVQVFDFGYHTDGSAYIVMEYLEGEPLDRRLARLGKLAAYDALLLCRQIASSLAAAHAQNIIHRDLKPENIYLVHDGEVASGERSKILDFGIAKLSDDNPGKIKTNTGALMGTPIYMSPEQCRGLATLDHRSDIYSLGCVLFHLLTGRPPFEGEGMGDIIAAHIREPAPAPSSCAPEIAPAIDALLLRCLAKPPDERFQTMHELAAAIGQILPYITSPAAPTKWVYAYPGGPTPAPQMAPPSSSYPGGGAPQPPYPSQPGTPTPPPPASSSYPGGSYPGGSYPGGPPQPPYPSRPGAPVTPVPPPGTPVPPPPGFAPAKSPTTLGASNGQVAPGSLLPAPRSRKVGWVLATALTLGGVGAVVAVMMTRDGGHAAAHDAVIGQPAIPDPAQAAIPPAPADAAIAVAVTPDAGPPDAAVPVPIDAAPVAADAAPVPIDAPSRRTHRSHAPAAPHAGSGSTTTPPGCDRSIDTDCDGIPDVR
ncbi:MAG TPA: serine/threonine-protein kinase [Kofleriaceae bacterium]|nr:serine/threonine-protein kinase [Kofleriaceae bacterium]